MLEEKGEVAPRVEHRILRVDDDLGANDDIVRRRGETMLRYPVPDAAEEIRPDTFYGVTQEYERLVPERVEVEGEEFWVVFRTSDLQPVARGQPTDFRVFGGFDPDEEHYGYRDDDGELIDLPVAAAWDYFLLRGTVEPSPNRR